MKKTNNMNAIKEANTNGTIQEATTADGKRTISHKLLNACTLNRANSRSLKISMFAVREQFDSWALSCKKLQEVLFEVRKAQREGEMTDSQKLSYSKALENAKIEYGFFLKRFEEKGLMTFSVDNSSDIAELSIWAAKMGKETPEDSETTVLIVSNAFFRKKVEDFLSDRILQKGYKSGTEQLKLKEERAARRKAKKAAEKLAKAEAELAKKEASETTPKTA